MRSLLLLASDQASKDGNHFGELFDAALIETIRTLSEPRPDLRVYIPWSDSLAPLVSVATLDASPSFDPETHALRQNALVPYLSDSQQMGETSRAFWNSSFLSLSREPPRSFSAVLDGRIDATLALGLPQFDLLRGALRRSKVLFFPELIARDAFAREVGGQLGTLIDLSANYVRDTLRRDQAEVSEREREDSLEPFVPFGLLLQRWLDEDLHEEPLPRYAR
jgi:hypothetical protein